MPTSPWLAGWHDTQPATPRLARARQHTCLSLLYMCTRPLSSLLIAAPVGYKIQIHQPSVGRHAMPGHFAPLRLLPAPTALPPIPFRFSSISCTRAFCSLLPSLPASLPRSPLHSLLTDPRTAASSMMWRKCVTRLSAAKEGHYRLRGRTNSKKKVEQGKQKGGACSSQQGSRCGGWAPPSANPHNTRPCRALRQCGKVRRGHRQRASSHKASWCDHGMHAMHGMHQTTSGIRMARI